MPLPLDSLFRKLLEHGATLSVRDYLDAVRALDAGFGGRTRDELRSLVDALWARSPLESAFVKRWFDAIQPLPAASTNPLELLLDASVRSLLPGLRADQRGPDADTGVEAGAVQAAPDAIAPTRAAAGAHGDMTAHVAFDSSREGGGLTLPRVRAEPFIEDDYQLDAQPLVPLRHLVVLWRRYRRTVRSGRKDELDLEETIRSRCRQGSVSAPVLRARRRNAARLLVLADASASMTPWLPFLDTMAESLTLARLGMSAFGWFDNVPQERVHASARLDRRHQPLDDWLSRAPGAGLLIVSDAGAARGVLNRRRARETAAFVRLAAATCGRIVWLNPMPEPRWAGTTAALVARDPGVVMLPLEAAQMMRAVDVLRGHK